MSVGIVEGFVKVCFFFINSCVSTSGVCTSYVAARGVSCFCCFRRAEANAKGGPPIGPAAAVVVVTAAVAVVVVAAAAVLLLR